MRELAAPHPGVPAPARRRHRAPVAHPGASHRPRQAPVAARSCVVPAGRWQRERERLAQSLHDDVIQDLSAMGYALPVVLEALPDDQPRRGRAGDGRADDRCVIRSVRALRGVAHRPRPVRAGGRGPRRGAARPGRSGTASAGWGSTCRRTPTWAWARRRGPSSTASSARGSTTSPSTPDATAVTVRVARREDARRRDDRRQRAGPGAARGRGRPRRAAACWSTSSPTSTAVSSSSNAPAGTAAPGCAPSYRPAARARRRPARLRDGRPRLPTFSQAPPPSVGGSRGRSSWT